MFARCLHLTPFLATDDADDMLGVAESFGTYADLEACRFLKCRALFQTSIVGFCVWFEPLS